MSLRRAYGETPQQLRASEDRSAEPLGVIEALPGNAESKTAPVVQIVATPEPKKILKDFWAVVSVDQTHPSLNQLTQY